MPWCEPLSFFGRRRAKTVNGVETRFLSAGDEGEERPGAARQFAIGNSDLRDERPELKRRAAEYTSAGVLLRRYVPGPGTDMPVAMVTPQAGGAQEVKYIHADRQGSVLALSNASGALVEGPFTYDPYGVSADASIGFPYRYTARRLDPETGLYYYRARYYSAALGRFLQTDPIGYQDQMNLYGYVGNDPLNATDPSGKVCTNNKEAGTTRCHDDPTDKNNRLYDVTFATPEGFDGTDPFADNYHTYYIGHRTSRDAGTTREWVRRNPVPNPGADPATPEGKKTPQAEYLTPELHHL